MDCVYCGLPLICESCGTQYLPPTLEHYHALGWAEVPIYCTECEHVLFCHWCKVAYSGEVENSEPR